jgi:cysteine desulfurase
MCNVEGPPLKKQRASMMPSTDPMPIYLDYNATTPLGPESWEAMVKHHNVFGNPSSTHPFGLESKFVVDSARRTIGEAIGAEDPLTEIIFTSGGTESNNLAIVGTVLGLEAADAKALPAGGEHASDAAASSKTTSDHHERSHRSHRRRDIIITSNFEHPAVEKVLLMLSQSPYHFRVFKCKVDGHGLVTTGELRRAIREAEGHQEGAEANSPTHKNRQRSSKVALVTIMHANNEIGIVQDIKALSQVVREEAPGAFFHTDAAQTVGKVPVNVQDLGVDLLSVCGHKFYAPKGSGCLYVRKGTPLKNVTFGADHERGLRPGTENILLNSALAAGVKAAVDKQPTFAATVQRQRQILYDTLSSSLKRKNMAVLVNGADLADKDDSCCSPASSCSVDHLFDHCLPNTLSIAIVQPKTKTYIGAARLITEMGHMIAMSAGSACHSTAEPGKPIHVSGTLTAIGCSTFRAMGTLRLSLGRYTTDEEMVRAGKLIAIRASQQLTDW